MFQPHGSKIHGWKVRAWKVHGCKVWGWKVQGWSLGLKILRQRGLASRVRRAGSNICILNCKQAKYTLSRSWFYHFLNLQIKRHPSNLRKWGFGTCLALWPAWYLNLTRTSKSKKKMIKASRFVSIKTLILFRSVRLIGWAVCSWEWTLIIIQDITKKIKFWMDFSTGTPCSIAFELWESWFSPPPSQLQDRIQCDYKMALIQKFDDRLKST